jgi:uncharacterized protein (TIGR02646 family)
MKHTRALTCEPTLLAKYRNTNPSEDQRPASEATATWNQFKTDKAAYKELLDKLAEAQQGLCLYCEQRLVHPSNNVGARVAGVFVHNDYQVEHVQPKSGAMGLVLDWQNLALACGGGVYPHHQDSSRYYSNTTNRSCGQCKDDQVLPAGCDPRNFPLIDAIVEVDINGVLSVNSNNCASAQLSTSGVEEAIKLLGLNCERLRKARQERHKDLTKLLVEILQELLNGSHNLPAERQAMRDMFIAGRLRPDSSGYLRAFWSTERCALGQDAETWISNNQGIFS